MSNEEIIANTAIAAGIYTQEEVEEILAENGELPLHSVMGWKMRSPRGYEIRIKKGEHGIETRLWKKRKNKAGKEELEAKTEENSEVQIMRSFYLAKTYLFDKSQVELIRVEGGEEDGKNL